MNDLKNIKERVSINLMDYNNTDSVIESVELKNFGSEHEPRHTVFVQTKLISDESNIRGVEFLGISVDSKTNEMYYGSLSNASKMLKHFNAKTFEDLVGKSCKLRMYPKKNSTEMRLGIDYAH